MVGGMTHRVVIIGGGFAGLNCARALRRADVQVTLIDRRNHHLFQPLLYQVATGGLSPANISTPLRALFARQRNVDIMLGEVTDIDVQGRRVLMTDGEIAYDTLVVATGSHHHYFGNEQWAAIAPGLKTNDDATEIRRKILLAFERADREPDADARRAWLTFVLVGGGPTGVELSGAIAEIAHKTLRGNFRHIDPAEARILLIEAAEHVLANYPEDLSKKAKQALEGLGVDVRAKTMVIDVQPRQVTLEHDGAQETIAARTILWTAGVKASPLGAAIAKRAGIETDKAGRIPVTGDCNVAGYPELFVLGDLAEFKGLDGKPLPGVAQVAIQQGKYVAKRIRRRLRGRDTPPFRYRDRGNMATIGRNQAVADIGRWHFGGFFAWLLWLFVHLMYIASFQNRLLILIQWAWNYVTRNRSARLI